MSLDSAIGIVPFLKFYRTDVELVLVCLDVGIDRCTVTQVSFPRGGYIFSCLIFHDLLKRECTAVFVSDFDHKVLSIFLAQTFRDNRRFRHSANACAKCKE